MNKNIILGVTVTCLRYWWWFVILLSCNKKFDEPPLNTDPDVAVNMTIQELKSRYVAAGVFQKIEDDKTIAGIVTADDRSGNFYKQIVIQDETGGIPILLDGNNVYTNYPVGRRVFVKLKGLMLGDYGGTIQLGLDSSRSDDGRFLNVGRIPTARFDEFIIRGSYGNIVTPKIIHPNDFTKNISDPLLSMLVQVDNAEFREADLNKLYGDTSLAESAVNFTVRSCDKQSIILRNSSYARFAGIKVAQGNGALVGIASIFNSTIQMTIRDTSDVAFTGTRCNAIITPKTIGEIRQMYQGSNIALDNYTVGGTVISDAVTKNIASGAVILQSGDRGILVYLGGSITYAIGDSIVLKLTDADSLINYRNSLEIKTNKDFAKPAPIATGKIITHVSKTISEINATLGLPLGDPANFESTLINIIDASADPASFSGSHTLSDASGSIELYTQPAATFASQTIPAGNQTWTGYAGNFNASKQFSIRNTSDVTGFIASASFTAIYDFANVTTSSGATDPTPVPTVTNIVFGSFNAIGIGTASSAGGRFSFNSWPLGATNSSDIFTGTVDAAKYYEITITPTSGAIIDFSTITFTLQRSSQGIRQAIIRSSIDNFTNNVYATINPANANLSVVPTNIFQVADAVSDAQNGCTIILGTGFMNISSAITFRFYGFNAESTGGTFSIDNVKFDGGVR